MYVYICIYIYVCQWYNNLNISELRWFWMILRRFPLPTCWPADHHLINYLLQRFCDIEGMHEICNKQKKKQKCCRFIEANMDTSCRHHMRIKCLIWLCLPGLSHNFAACSDIVWKAFHVAKGSVAPILDLQVWADRSTVL